MGDVGEDDDDEDDDDEDEEDEEQPPAKKSKNVKEKETPAKKVEAAPPVKKDQEKAKAATEEPVDMERMKNRDAKTLFIKNFPSTCSVKQIKALSSDIKQVRLRVNTKFRKQKGKGIQTGYGYVEFASEELAEKNKPILEKSKLGGNTLVVDYVGAKSKHQQTKAKTEVENFDPLRLYIAGLPMDAKESDIRRLFPKASEITIPVNKKGGHIFGYGFVSFTTADLAKQYHQSAQGAKIKENPLVVLFAKQRKAQEESKKAAKKEKKAKKEKPAKKEEEAAAMEEDEDEEDEEDMEDDADDDEDDEDDDEDEDDEDDDDDDDDDDE